MATVYRVWRRADREDEILAARVDNIAKLLRKIVRVEDFVWPRADRDWLVEQNIEDADPLLFDHLVEFRDALPRNASGKVLKEELR